MSAEFGSRQFSPITYGTGAQPPSTFAQVASTASTLTQASCIQSSCNPCASTSGFANVATPGMRTVPAAPAAPAVPAPPKAAADTSGHVPDHMKQRMVHKRVLQQLWKHYSEGVLPIETMSYFGHFKFAPLTLEEFEARPQVLLLGQYSTGKTSMVKWLTDMTSPHFDVRPQPSTDKFMAVVHGDEERLIQGNAATCLPQLPYRGLSSFGANFLGSFQALVLPAAILKEITFIDTPGVLSGSKQRIGRDYEFARVCKWMAERADLVLLSFDAHKLDISDEFQEVMEVLRPYADKVRCVLNKADQIDATNLVRVYGALLWNVGKVLRTPEVARVFVSSFWDEEYRFKEHKQLFDEDKDAVLKELRALPRTALLRKINAFVARVRQVRAHYCVVAHIRSKVPWHFVLRGEGRLKQWAITHLDTLFAEAQRIRNLSDGDMPNKEQFRARLEVSETIRDFPVWDEDRVAELDRIIDRSVPMLINDVGGVTNVNLSCKSDVTPPVAKPKQTLLTRLGFSSGTRKRKSEAISE